MGMLEGKVAIVTGAGGGLGRAEALELARQGAAVLVNDIGTNVFGKSDGARSPADEVVATIREAGGRAAANYGDAGNWDQAKAMINEAVETFGGLDILVNNAGILRKGPMLDLEERDLRDLLHVHVEGTAIPLHHAGRYWREEHLAGRTRRASVINTTSRAGVAPRVPQIAWYGAAKGAIATLTLSAALEMPEFGVRVNAIAPHSFTRQDAAAQGVPYDPEEDHKIGPDKVAPVVAWLASDVAADVNGRVFWIEGGTLSHYDKWQIGVTVEAATGRWEADAIGPALEAAGFRP
ncbi:MAG: SDR family NAD(P)-dependent oxidoreductase [Bauldia sp.]|nr:SDR family NAD(P)-dependent oxidoreductase [Bauldia sp.]